MRDGICPLSTVPVRLFPEDSSEMVTQALYGDHFKILEMRKSWSRIRFGYDSYEGWIDNKQLFEISEEMYTTINLADPKLSADVMDYITTSQQLIFPIPIGSAVSQSALLEHIFEGITTTHEQDKSKIVDTAFMVYPGQKRLCLILQGTLLFWNKQVRLSPDSLLLPQWHLKQF